MEQGIIILLIIYQNAAPKVLICT